MKGVLEATRREATVTSKADLETFSVYSLGNSPGTQAWELC